MRGRGSCKREFRENYRTHRRRVGVRRTGQSLPFVTPSPPENAYRAAGDPGDTPHERSVRKPTNILSSETRAGHETSEAHASKRLPLAVATGNYRVTERSHAVLTNTGGSETRFSFESRIRRVPVLPFSSAPFLRSSCVRESSV